MYEFLGLEISIGTGTTSGASIYTAVPDLFGNLQLVTILVHSIACLATRRRTADTDVVVHHSCVSQTPSDTSD
ncbi:uncharacterized protein TrAFT101_010650 [Trichoderma asperellum]|uniref:uncharacterized protein n=1 Tax=Trichoderma asperellum TaxID=101201 RepID=UPI0033300752|nr:hypothetical protein TrAFT101_010650 [Trichoderma asperellum]